VARDLGADPEELEQALDGMGDADAVGHRVVHGGSSLTGAVAIDAGVMEALRAAAELAPLHQPPALRAIEAVERLRPGIPAVACFDTGFHATLPEAARTYALPAAWRERWPLRRFGFHGLSHAYAASRVPSGRLVTCHLGAGVSLSAVRDGVCVDTTMGFTPLEGPAMATRSGSVDPGLLIWLARRMPLDELEDGLLHESGLKGLAGTADMREVGEGLALDVYVHRLRAAVAAMTASLGGLDTLAFTGGVGEHAPAVRERVAAGLAFVGVAVDPARNAAAAADAEIGAGPVRVLVLTAREDLEIARQVRALLAAGNPQSRV